MLVALEFRARPGREADFEAHYAPFGVWARLFARSPDYRGTTLVRDASERRRYLLSDTWTDREAFDVFLAAHAAEYEALDRRCEALTEEERCLGWFSVVARAS